MFNYICILALTFKFTRRERAVLVYWLRLGISYFRDIFMNKLEKQILINQLCISRSKEVKVSEWI